MKNNTPNRPSVYISTLIIYFRSKDKILFTNLPISYPGMLTEVKDLDVKKLIMDRGEVECSPELIPEVDDE